MSSFPGVGGAPRHQPPANKRERLRRTKCPPGNCHPRRVNVIAGASMWPDGAIAIAGGVRCSQADRGVGRRPVVGGVGVGAHRVGGRNARSALGVRRRRSLWLAGGCSRGAGATPGRRADGNVARRASPAGGTSPPGKDVWVSSVPGVGGAPRHQPPANKRERLRRTHTRSARSCHPPASRAPAYHHPPTMPSTHTAGLRPTPATHPGLRRTSPTRSARSCHPPASRAPAYHHPPACPPATHRWPPAHPHALRAFSPRRLWRFKDF